jgi:hypothetical protein
MPVIEKDNKAHDRTPPKPEARNTPAIYNDFQDQAAKLLRKAMSDAGVDYEGLAGRLNDDGIKITYRGLENKISRGTFSASFLIHCMKVLGKPIT